MPAPTVSIPVTGTDPKTATTEGLEAQINAAFSTQQDEIDAKAVDAATTASLADRLKWRGAWIDQGSYVVNDAVTVSGTGYACYVTHIAGPATEPGAGESWEDRWRALGPTAAQMAAKAPLDSPAMTGNPTAPTQTAGNNSTRLATTAFVQAAVTALLDGAPGALDTLNELAAALGDDENFSATVTAALADRLKWRGAWIDQGSYVVNDAVTVSGTGYACYVTHIAGPATEPGVGASWEDRWRALGPTAADMDAKADAADVAPLTLTGTDDNLGALMDRATATHRTPHEGDLIYTSGDTATLPPPETNEMILSAVGSEAWAFRAATGWPLTDGAADGGPVVRGATLTGGNIALARSLDLTGYPAHQLINLPRIPRQWTVGKGINKIMVIAYTGQSQAVGYTEELLTTTAVAAGRALMLSGGARLTQMNHATIAKEDFLTPASYFDGLIDLLEQVDPSTGAVNESPMSALVGYILPDLPETTAVVAINVAVGSQTIENLSIGTSPWQNLALAIGMVRLWAEDAGLEFDVGGLFVSQGGANAANSIAAYKTAFTDGIHDPWDALMQAHGFAALSKPVFFTGMTHNTASADMNVAQAALALNDDPALNVVATVPEYLFRNETDDGGSDTTHISAQGLHYREYFNARAFVAEVIDQTGWTPFRMLPGSLSGVRITLPTEGGASPLILAHPQVVQTGLPNYGFSYRDNGDGNTATISDITVSADSLLIDMDVAPTATGIQIGYALAATATTPGTQGPVTGARGSIGDGATGTIAIDGSNYEKARPLWTGVVDIT